MVTAISPPRSRPGLGLGAGLVAAARGLAFCGLMLAGLGLLLVLLAALGLTALGAGLLIIGNGGPRDQRALLVVLVLAAGLGIGRFYGPAALLAMRRLANLTRRLAGEWCGVPIAGSYRTPPGSGDSRLSFSERLGWLLTDGATWRGLLWVTANVHIRHSDGMLRIGVTDNGLGGADPARGSGLRGIERRLAPFDGVLAVSSPPGGPTAVTMEIPCAWSSPKTSSC